MDAILLAAGRGVRMRSDKPKQLLRLAGKPIVVHSLEVLESVRSIDRVFVTYAPGFGEEISDALRDYQLTKPVLVEGGATRQLSVANALERVTSPRVLVHEAARPFINEEFVQSLLDVQADAVVPTVPISFTVAEGDRLMTRVLKREELHNVQLPQVFDTAKLREAHSTFHEPADASEDSQMVFRLGYAVRFVEGMEHNIKITTPLDLHLAEVIYSELMTWGVC